MLFVLLLPVLFLISGPDRVSVGIGIAVYLGLGTYLCLKLRGQKVRDYFTIRFPIPTVLCAILLGVWFYIRWNNNPVFISREVLPTMPAKRICGLFAAGLTLFSVFGIGQVFSSFTGKKSANRNDLSPAEEYSFIGLTSTLVISLVSRCSPFYAFNDWVDPHTMFNVGKGIIHGMTPYRDIYEQKGPLILALHALAAAFSFDSLIGIWILEIISCFWFLFFTYRILKLRFGQRGLLFIPVLALTIFSAVSFEQGDSAEEFSLPILMFGLFVGIRSLREHRLPYKKDWIRIGISSGCMLWMKYSMLGFYIGWIIALYIFVSSQGRKLDILKGIGWVAVGVMLVGIPILLWFAIAGALPDLFQVYFYQNMFLYPNTIDLYGNFALLRNLGNGLLNFVFFSTVLFLFDAIGLVWLSRNAEKPVYRLVLYSFVSLFLLMYFSGRFYSYYSLIYGVFTVFGLAAAGEFVQGKMHAEKSAEGFLRTGLPIILCACVLGCFGFSGNMRSLAYQKEDYPQYQIKSRIEASGIENPTLMNYGFLSMGADTAAGLIPSQRFFCSFNLPLDEIAKDQNACLDSGCTDFVMTFMIKVHSQNYKLIGQYDALYNFAGLIPKYNLYQRVDND